ncbi:PREDICTED: L-ascorbate oxidase homolog [Camelina sativa]|uniref:L-ascorbate oxidase homolog n=1 Tax=Camelina sativa TaxID=90675 RepID=A0ABM0U719_CAMSA|nr:PREDICTED: L-ascorbate oxidase homolog [Camelina sativa]
MGWWLNGGVRTIMMAMTIISFVHAEDPYRFFDWRVTYGNISPLGIPLKGILINGQYPGPDIYSVTNDNLIINVHNELDEPFLLSWNGVQLRKNSYQDGVYGTTCPIPPGKNYTYAIQVKDQIGSFFYFPSLAVHKAVGGFGGFRILSRPRIPVPFPEPAGDFTFLISDWFERDHKTLKALLDRGHKLPLPQGVLINGQGVSFSSSLTVEKGKTYRFRISNVGIQNTLNFRIHGHQMKLVEVEGTHTVQSMYTSLDIHVGQSYSVLVTMDQPDKDYDIVVSTKFAAKKLLVSSTIHYSNSRRHNKTSPSVHVEPPPPADELDWSIKQARSIRTNLTASGPRPNPQGSYHYGRIKISRTLILESSAALVHKKQRYAINGVSFVAADTPLKLADYFKIKGVFKVESIPDKPRRGVGMRMDTSVMGANHRDFFEIIFQNREKVVQSYHLDGYNFWVVGMDRGTWTKASRREYNLRDAVSRSTTQVYPESWTAVYVALDNVGMWNLRSEYWARQYLGQQFYLRVYSPAHSLRDEYLLPKNALLCGRASNKQHTPIITP